MYVCCVCYVRVCVYKPGARNAGSPEPAFVTNICVDRLLVFSFVICAYLGMGAGLRSGCCEKAVPLEMRTVHGSRVSALGPHAKKNANAYQGPQGSRRVSVTFQRDVTRVRSLASEPERERARASASEILNSLTNFAFAD